MANEAKLVEYLKRVTAELHETQEQLREAEDARHEPIAIVGMSCRFPGGVASPEDLWTLVAEGRDAVSEFPADRGWKLDEVRAVTPVHEGGFLDGADLFDAGFFGISPREATTMDPQQRLLLETSWEALERAGVDPLSLRGSRTGVYVGSNNQDHLIVVASAGEEAAGLGVTGATASVLSGRVSNFLGLEGPAVTVDTACSSSLLSLHLAMRSLREGETTLALAGGVALMATPAMFVESSRQQALASDGRCKAFAASADGTGWGEGVGWLLLERLSDARRNGRTVLAVVRGSAVNQDGASNGLTAPSGPAQQRVITEALADAGLSPAQIDLVEAHGTGTALGDPIEAQALLAAYGGERPAERPLWLGSLKSNIGHAQAAAGVGGVIKVVMALRHETVPPTLHAEQRTERVDWSSGHIELVTRSREWPATGEPRRAAVSSFGMSGTNAHVVIEQSPAEADAPADGDVPAGPLVWVLSARTQSALRAQAARLLTYVDSHPDVPAGDIGRSLITSRSSFERRAVVVGGDREELTRGLTALAEGLPSANLVEGTASFGDRVVFVFPNHGSQWPGMAVELLDTAPVFRDELLACDQAFGPHIGYSVVDVLRGAHGVPDLENVEAAQTALFCVMVSLAALWRAYGVEPSAVIGHSQGELVAACVAGALSIRDVAPAVVARSRALQTLAGPGGMISVRLGHAELRPRLQPWAGRIGTAAINGPNAVVLSGDRDALEQFAGELTAEGVSVRTLPTDVAGHSHHAEQLREQLADVFSALSATSTAIPFFSTVTGRRADTAEFGGEHWFQNLRSTVRFDSATRAALDQGYRLLLEVSPHPVLSGGIQEIIDETGVPAAVSGTLRRDAGGLRQFLRALAEAYVHGVPVDFSRVFAGLAARRIDLPTYPFEHARYRLLPSQTAGEVSSLGLVPVGHPLVPVGATLPGSGGLLTGMLSRQTHPWLAEHVVLGNVVVPGTVYLDLAFRAGDLVHCDLVDELALQVPLVLSDHGGAVIQVHVGARQEDDRHAVSIHSRTDAGDDEEWICHATGWLRESAGPVPDRLVEWPPAGARRVEIDGLYDRLSKAGIEYGPEFQGLRGVWQRGAEIFADVALPDEAAVAGYGLHPVLLDTAFHALFAAVPPDGSRPMRMLFAWSDARLLATGATALRVRLTPTGDDTLAMLVTDVHGEPVATVGELLLREVVPENLTAAARDRLLFRPEWTAISGGTLDDEVVYVDAGRWPVDTAAPVLAVGITTPAGAVPDAVRQMLRQVGELVEDFLADERLAGSRLVLLTGNAAAVGEQAPDLVQAPLLGLVRSIGHDRVRLVDTDGLATSTAAIPAAIAAGEPLAAVRDGVVHVPRLVRVPAEADPVDPVVPGRTGAVLVVGTSDARADAIIRHLIDGGAPEIVLVGDFAPVAGVTVLPCAPDDPESVAGALRGLPDLPATIIHTGPVNTAVLWTLHELAGDSAAITSFTSVDGLFGTGERAEETAFAMAFAAWRRDRGAPTTALVWGPWSRSGLSPAEGVRLFGEVLARDEAVLVPMRLGPDSASPDELLLRGLVHAPSRRTAGGAARPESGLAGRLAGLGPVERVAATVDLVRAEVAAILGYADPQEFASDKAFRDLGFASITAVELRNRLAAVTGLTLPTTLVFDHPSVRELAEHLVGLVLGEVAAPAPVAVRSHADEPIAIVGMSCRFPGGVDSPDDLWRLVADGVDAIGDLPRDRDWDIDALHSTDQGASDTAYVRQGGFLGDVRGFDAGFFGISPREALAMDPQQRILMETVWEALEHAGLDPAVLRGTDTGVFVGSNGQDHAIVLAGSADDLTGYRATGVSASIMSGRIAYTLGLEGPAITVDTACSSSLVSLHLAAQALARGECSLALAGGCSVLSTPTQLVEFSKQNALAPDGRSKAYSDSADGFAVSEGAGWLVLERLSDARRNGHSVLAVVRGSAVNQDGASNGLTAPNGPAQQRVIGQALANAGLATTDVDAVEGHGTGTALGDPIEVLALAATYGRDGRDTPLLLGSLKSNIGHAQAAAGVGGVIKMVQALRHGVLPRTLHVDAPTREVDWTRAGVELLTERRPWPETGRPRRAAVSSFGISGTNAHIVLEQGPDVPVAVEATERVRTVATVPWVLSGKSVTALRAQAARLLAHVTANPEVSIVDIGLSLAGNRGGLEHRAVVLGADRAQLCERLSALASGEPVAGVVEGSAGAEARVAFVFPGQGSQWEGMAQDLLDTSAAFTDEFMACCIALESWIDWSPIDVLRGRDGAPGLDRVDVVQPLLWAVMVSLAALWRSYGVEPAAVIGHSQGEIAAAYAIGALSRDEAARVVALRSRALVRIAGTGGMMSVQLGRIDIAGWLEPWKGEISIAAVNGPQAVVVAGEPDRLRELHAALTGSGVSARIIPVDYAAHSGQVDQIHDVLGEALTPVTSTETTTPFFSCVDGERRTTGDLDADYWRRNLRQTVEFERAVRAVVESGIGLVIEVSPHPVLTMAVEDTFDELGVAAAAWGTLRRGENGPGCVLRALAEAHVRGVPVRWAEVFASTGARVVDVPTYAFQREQFWPAPPRQAAADAWSMGLVAAGHPLLSAEIGLPDSDLVLLTGRISLRTHPWLADHVVSGMVIVPGTAFMELGFRAAEQVGCARVEELTVQAPLLLAERASYVVQVVIAAPVEGGQRQLTVYARPEQSDEELDESEWTCHATGWLSPAAGAEPDTRGLLEWPPAGARHVSAHEVYEMLVARGYGYGPIFQGLREVWVRGSEVFADVALPVEARAEAGAFGMHPALFDAAFHALIAGQPRDAEQPLRLPFSWTGVELFTPGTRSMRVRMELTSEETVSVVAVDELGRPVVSVSSLLVREIPAAVTPSSAAGGHYRALYTLGFAPLASSGARLDRWAVVGDSALAGSLAQAHPAVPGFPDWAALARTEPAPDVVVVPVDASPAGEGTDVPGSVRQVAGDVLGVVQQWLTDERFARSRLVVVTRDATGAAPDVSQAPVWGLLRCAQSENPDRLMLLDVDEDERSARALPGAIADGFAADELQIAVRAGEANAARLARVPVAEPAGTAPELDPEGTVLVTGATGLLAGHVARHLARRGIRHLVLLSRRGDAAPTTSRLVAELGELGTRTTVVAGDAGDREVLRAALDAIPAEHPLTGVVHTAGVLDDALTGSLTPDRLDTVFRPKVDAAWHLHELTRDLPIALFALFSSAAGVLGGGGQGNYAAANAFLDALAARRRRSGLPATSLAWGMWERSQDPDNPGLAGHLDATHQGRATRGGLLPISFEQGMTLFDTALSLAEPALLPMRMDVSGLRSSGAPVPSLLRGLVIATARRGADAAPQATGIKDRLAGLSGTERERFMVDFVRGQAAAVLGYASAHLVPLDEAFRDLGFDSLTAVELRNRLKVGTGLALPATLVFDHPNARALAVFLIGELVGDTPDGTSGDVAPAQSELDRLEAALNAVGAEEAGDERVSGRLKKILDSWILSRRPAGGESRMDLGAASVDDLLAYIDKDLGRSHA